MLIIMKALEGKKLDRSENSICVSCEAIFIQLQSLVYSSTHLSFCLISSKNQVCWAVDRILQWDVCLVSFPGHFQILSRSRGEKSGKGLWSKLCHRPEMVNLVSTLVMRTLFVLTESTISGLWHSFDPRPSPNFSPQLQDIKSGSGLGTRLMVAKIFGLWLF